MPSSIPNTTSKIFELIKSLNKSEVRYFRRHVGRNATNEQIYLTVFNEILKMTAYNEERLVKKLDIKVSNLKVVKSQLYTRITDKLHEFHLENSIEERVKKDIHLIKILLEKNLKDHVPKILKRTRNTILKYELFEQLPDLLKIEQLIWDKNWYNDINESDIRALYEKMVEGLEQQKTLSFYMVYRCIVRKAHFDDAEVHDEDIRALGEPNEQTSLRAKIEYYRVLATYHFMTKAIEKAYVYNQKLLKIYEDNLALIELFPQDYMVTLYHYLVDSFNLKKYDDIEEGIKKMEDLLEQEPFKKILSLRSKVFEMLYSLRFNQIIEYEDFKNGIQLIEKFETEFKKYKSEIAFPPKTAFYYMIAYIFLANQQYEAGLEWIRKITQHRSNNPSKVELAAYILELILNYEIGHLHIDTQIVNVQNRIRRIRELYQSERKLFALLNELTKTRKPEKKEVFKRYLPIIAQLKENPEEADFFNYFDLLWWVKSKVGD